MEILITHSKKVIENDGISAANKSYIFSTTLKIEIVSF